VHLDIERKTNVVPHDFKRRMLQDRREVRPPPGIEIIYTEHFMPCGYELCTQVRTEETRSTCDEDSLTQEVYHNTSFTSKFSPAYYPAYYNTNWCCTIALAGYLPAVTERATILVANPRYFCDRKQLEAPYGKHQNGHWPGALAPWDAGCCDAFCIYR